MTNRFRKSDIDTHSEPYRPSKPAINVKVYHYPQAYRLADDLNISEGQAEIALGYCYDSAQARFWEDAQDRAREIWGDYVKVYSEGRSGGWLIVDGINEDVESWDAIAVSQWGRLDKWCKEEIKYLCSEEYVKEEILANRWNEEGAELYNFVDLEDHTACMIDLKNKAVEVLTAADLPVGLLLRG